MTHGRNSRPATVNGHLARRAAALCAGLLAWLSIALAAGAPAAVAAEEETHIFDATLSLTGNCEASRQDPVPDPSCPETTPDGAFPEPLGVTTDSYGDIFYVGRPAQGEPVSIYVFDSAGRFLTAVPSYAMLERGRYLAVDGTGNLYVSEIHVLYVLRPSAYDPEGGEIAYGNAPELVETGSLAIGGPVVAEQTTGKVFAVGREEPGRNTVIAELGSLAEGNSLLRTFGGDDLGERNSNLAVDGTNERVYVSEKLPSGNGAFPSGIKVFDFEGNLLKTMTGVKTTEGFHEFTAPFGNLGLAVDEATGHLFIGDVPHNPKPAIYELDPAGEPVSAIAHSLGETNGSDQIWIDNGLHSPNSSMNPESPLAEEENPHGSYLFVPSGTAGTGHLYAFAPKPIPKAPLIEAESFAGVGNTEAVLRATVNPNGLAGEFHFEYVTAASFDRDVEEVGPGHGFDHATSAGAGTLAAGIEGVSVSTPLDALEAGTAYYFRVVAASACEGEAAPACETQGEAVAFATYSSPALSPAPCASAAPRIGLSAALPDCRAYELVTPANTNGHAPLAPTNNSAGPKFGTPPASATGEAVGFIVLGGAIPGYPGTGAFNGDAYVATRTAAGWQTASAGPSGTLTTNPSPGGFSPDLRYVAWYTGPEDRGSLVRGGTTNYIRYPDGSEHLVGEGSLGTDPVAQPLLVSAGAAHVVFRTGTAFEEPPRLEPAAPPTGTPAIYDRTPGGVLHVVSLLPGNVTPAAGEGAKYQGASAGGSTIAFKVGAGGSPLAWPLYLRLNDERTLEAAGPGATFEGLSAGGRYAFYLQGGDLYRYDTGAEAATRITHAGDVTVVNIPSRGTSAYFASPSVLPEAGENPNGAEAVGGEANLYYWDGAGVHFVATLSERDMEGEFTGGGGGTRDGLGLWTASLSSGSTAVDPSRTTAGGGTIVFESNADLAGYDSGGAAEIYRYDDAGSLACLSCNPTLAPGSGDARLQTVSFTISRVPTGIFAVIPSLSAGGRRVFFESPDALVPADTDGVRDVYEWEGEGEGSCATPGGCVFLISSGQSADANYLYGASESGKDVFIYTSDLLTDEDRDETPSVYDVRVGGGFAGPASRAGECLGEACQPAAIAPEVLTPASSVFHGAGNERPKRATRHCRKARDRGRGRTRRSARGRRGRRCGRVRHGVRHRRRRHHHRKHRGHGERTHDKRRAAR